MPEGMTVERWQRLAKLDEFARLRVLERAAILHYEAGVPWAEADERAWREEQGRRERG